MRKFVNALAALQLLFVSSRLQQQPRSSRPYGGKTLIVSGPIRGEATSPSRLTNVVKAVNAKGVKVERMFFNSPGGNILAGIKIASAVRSLPAPYRIDMVIGRTDICASICDLIFAAGHHKVVFPTSKLGVHSAGTINAKGNANREDLADMGVTLIIARLMKSYGTPATVVAKMITQPMNGISWIMSEDAIGWSVEVIRR